MTDFCLVCGKRHGGAVRGGIVRVIPKACRQLERSEQRHERASERAVRAVATQSAAGVDFSARVRAGMKRCACGVWVRGRHRQACPLGPNHPAPQQ